MKGRIVSIRYDKHTIQLFVLGGRTWEAGMNGTRYWKTVEDARKYAEKNGIEIIGECWLA